MLNWFEKHNKISWTITLLIASIIFYLSSKTFPTSTIPTTNILSIAYHFLAFFFLALFLLISISKGKLTNSKLLSALTISILYGISDELHQSLVPGRYCCFSDIFTNSAGILTAGLLYSIYAIKYHNFKPLKDRVIF